jgi:hypothetical protein
MAHRSKSPTKTVRPATREGKRMVSIFVEPRAFKQFKQLALDTEMTGQDLGREALNLLFEKHQRDQIA